MRSLSKCYLWKSHIRHQLGPVRNAESEAPLLSWSSEVLFKLQGIYKLPSDLAEMQILIL